MTTLCDHPELTPCADLPLGGWDEAVLIAVIEAFRTDGSVTIHPEHGNLKGCTGFAVSIGEETVLTAEELTPLILGAFILARSGDLVLPMSCLGVWRNQTGHAVVDVSLVLTSQRRAIRLARRENQEAIYSLQSGQLFHLRSRAAHIEQPCSRRGHQAGT